MEIVYSAPDGDGVITTSFFPSDSSKAVMVNINCASNVQIGSPHISTTTYLTIAVCKYIDASNFCVQLSAPGPFGGVVEVIADGGSIEIFAPTGSTFLDGSSSLVTSTGARFRYVIPTSGPSKWAKID